MAKTNGTALEGRKTIGMDMVPPYAVYVDGDEVAVFETEREAGELFNKLTGSAPEVSPVQ